MLKVLKPYRIGSCASISNEMGNDIPNLNKLLKPKYPKNVLRSKFIGIKVGQNGDDFIRNVSTIVATWEITRFKR